MFDMVQYGNRCKFYMPYVPELANEDRNEDGRDICGQSFEKIKDCTGRSILRTYGEVMYCPNCDQLMHDDRTIVFKKCSVQNRNLNCKDFSPKLKWKLIFMLSRGK